ncbi:hypothetical protein TCA2_3055 [Paenibacillus sp. TCA20]|nr:hypothetical protein TCA2_3055 [Paenibacillus sp. TCA20]
MQSRPFYFIVLCPDPEMVAEREAARDKKGYGDWSLHALDQVLRNETSPVGMRPNALSIILNYGSKDEILSPNELIEDLLKVISEIQSRYIHQQ